MNSHSERRNEYDAAAEHLREVIAACQTGPSDLAERDEMYDLLAKALEAFETAKEALWGTERGTS